MIPVLQQMIRCPLTQQRHFAANLFKTSEQIASLMVIPNNQGKVVKHLCPGKLLSTSDHKPSIDGHILKLSPR